MEDNKEWKEFVSENFDVALGEGDYVRCKELIETAKDEGEIELAKEMDTALKESQWSNFK